MVKNYEPLFIYCHQANQGPAAARNKGVSLAKGEYIAFCDHDDIWNDRHLELLITCLSSYSDSALAFDNAEYFGDSLKNPKLHLDPVISRSLASRVVPPSFLLWHYPIASMSVTMVKKQVFEKLGGLKNEIVALDDLHFYLRLAATNNVRYVDFVGCRRE